MDEAVTTALDAAFTERSVERLTDVGPSWNGANETVGVVFADGGRAFCKVAIDGDGTRIARELAVLRYVAAERPIAVPEVLAADPDADPPYLVTGPAPGRELLDAWEERECDAEGGPRCEALLRRVGATLATLHAERFETHGEIVGSHDRDGLALERAPWPDVLLKTIERTREIGTSERLGHHYDAVIDCVEANRDRLGDAPAALLHGDVAMPNLFVVGDEPVGDADAGGIAPIDWELAHVGDPARDLVRAEDQLLNGFDTRGPDRYAAALRAGYAERAGGLPAGFAARRPIYEVVRMLGRSGFVDQWTTYVDEPMDALVDRAEAELRARLEAV
ncbi:phosphotransferase family protein [Halorubrum depositum]|uniref:phosphotransferase family protein n=1 Tax=Halorubrum depositum TaxID=2583992 RepID=UPI0011A3FF66|nr:aminoglycoside phosphotransferase family protein [Halorubrum depositum]